MPPHKVKLVYKNYVFFHINNVHLLKTHTPYYTIWVSKWQCKSLTMITGDSGREKVVLMKFIEKGRGE